MLRDLLKEGGLYTIANLLTKGVSLLLIPFYTAYFSPEDYGIIDVLSVFGVLLTTIFSLQLNQGLGRYVADSGVQRLEKRRIASTAILIVSIIYIIIAFLILLFPETTVQYLSTDETKIPTKIFQYSILATLLSGMFYFLGVYLRFLRRVKAFSILTFSFALSNILLMLILILTLDMGIEGIYLSSILLSPIFLLITLYIIRKEIVLFLGRKQFVLLFKYSAPLVPASIAYVLMTSIDRFYIKEMLSFDESGIYGIAFKFSTIITIIITGFTMAMNPIVFANYEKENAKNEVRRMFSFFFVIGSTGLLCLSLFSYETIYIFTNSNYYDAANLMPIMYLSVLISGMGMFSPGINLAKKTIVGALIIIFSSIVNLILNYFFIIEFNSIGAAIATLISVSIFYISYFIISQKYYRINLNFKKFMPFILINLLLILVGSYLLKYSFSVNIFIKILIIILYSFLMYNYFVKGKLKNIKLKN